jgi:hypothetical protein
VSPDGGKSPAPSAPKEVLWGDLAFAAQARVRTLATRAREHPRLLPAPAAAVLSSNKAPGGRDVKELGLALRACGLSSAGGPVDLLDRLESAHGFVSTAPGGWAGRTVPASALDVPASAALLSTASGPWWARSGYRGDEAFPREFAQRGGLDAKGLPLHPRHWRFDDILVAEAVRGKSWLSAAQLEARLFPRLPSAAAHRERSRDGGEWVRAASALAFTTDPLVRHKVWADLEYLSTTAKLVERLAAVGGGGGVGVGASSFRCDAYGNVVSLVAANFSLTNFDVDHCFPWSRGGLSEMENARALHAGANRHRKGAHLLVDAGRMVTGLSAADFRDLVDAVIRLVRERTREEGKALLGVAWEHVRALCTRPLRLAEGKKGKTLWRAFVATHGLLREGGERVDWEGAVALLYKITWAPGAVSLGVGPVEVLEERAAGEKEGGGLVEGEEGGDHDDDDDDKEEEEGRDWLGADERGKLGDGLQAGE